MVCVGIARLTHISGLIRVEQSVVVVHTFNPSTQEADLCEFKASLVYRVSSSTARTIQRDRLCLEKQTKQNKKSKKKKLIKIRKKIKIPNYYNDPLREESYHC